MLNPVLMQQLETFGLTDDHLAQLVAVCERGAGRATWHIDPNGFFAKVEVTLFASRRDSRGMRELTRMLKREHA